MRSLAGEGQVDVTTSRDVIMAREAVRRACHEVGLGLVDETKIVTAASELARNLLMHATGRRRIVVSVVEEDGRRGVRVVSSDEGPGIPDIVEALRAGFSTGQSMGVGLPGAQRIVDRFEIESSPAGTRVEVTKWRR